MGYFPDKEIVAGMKTWFNSYVGAFKFDNHEQQQNIDIKREHTERAVKEIVNIGKELGLNDDELELAGIIALFHDIGRFEQYNLYKTFSDHKSLDHAELGIKILVKHNVLGMLDEEIQKLILCSIKYHNRPSLPGEETEKCLFYSRLVRDADKLDILRVVTDYYHREKKQINPALVLELPDSHGISGEVYEALMNKKVVDMRHVKNVNDIKLLQAGLIYDINFEPTLNDVKNRRYIEKIREVLPNLREIDKIFNLIYLSSILFPLNWFII